MDRLTPEERRRTFLRRQEASRQMLAQTLQPIVVREPSALAPWLSQALRTGMIAALLGGSLIVWQVLAFQMPGSVVEAFLPRL